METIRIFSHGEKEFRNLEYVARIMTMRSENGVTYEVGDTYFDFGQGWEWTTIIAYRNEYNHWQCLSPAEQGKIVSANFDELDTIVLELMKKCEKEYPSLYSFRKYKKTYSINVTKEVTTIFTVEAEDADEAEQIFDKWSLTHGEEIRNRFAEEYATCEVSYPEENTVYKADITKEDI